MKTDSLMKWKHKYIYSPDKLFQAFGNDFHLCLARDILNIKLWLFPHVA